MQRAAGISAALLLASALILGGASQGNALPVAAAELLALPALGIGLWLTIQRWETRRDLFAVAILLALVLVPLIQLIPLPGGLWSALPGRGIIVAVMNAAGIALPHLPVSLTPEATLHSALALVPPTGLFLIVPHLSWKARTRLAVAILGVVLIGVVLGIAQVAGGPESPLRFYAQTNVEAGVGFFSNRNHQADFLACAIVFAAAWAVGQQGRERAARRLAAVVALALVVVFIVGVAVSGSRAGVLLAFAAVVGSLGILLRARGKASHGSLGVMAGGAACLVLFLAAQATRIPALERFHDGAANDLRWKAAPLVIAATRAHWPAGTGVGSFIPVYQSVEQPGVMVPEIFNHAHDDYLEVSLETGLAGWAIFAAFLFWWGARSTAVWRGGGAAEGGDLARAGSIIVVLMLVHSVVDYPLRTVALATLFAFAAGAMREGTGALSPRGGGAPG